MRQSTSELRLSFLGGVRTVTGSMFLISHAGTNILLECGLYQGRRAESNYRNRHPPIDSEKIDVMLLSHAHIDHSGNIPTLVKQGFSGRIYTTSATRDLCSIMLADSAHLQEKDAEFLNKQYKKKGKQERIEPLYTVQEAIESLESFSAVVYDKSIEVTDGVKVTYRDAGHILGSALLELEIKSNNAKVKRILFTGDLGRKNLPILRDPYQVEETDILIIESTYGNRLHDPIDTMETKLAQVINETIDRGGKIIVPAFSVGRTQEFVYILHRLTEQQRIPKIPIYVDSPLAIDATEIFRLHPECFDDQTKEYLIKHQDPFGFGKLQYIRDVEESKKLNEINYPCIIISASGMCEGGRILHHLKHNITDRKNTILIIGFMADNTLGKRLVDKVPIVRIFDEEYELKAQVVVMNSFSAHADRNELLDYVKNIKKKPNKVFVVHGNADQSEALATAIKEEIGIQEVVVPKLEDQFIINL